MDLSVLWFWIVAFLFVGYFVLDGFDFGVGMSLPVPRQGRHRPSRAHQHDRPGLGPQRDVGDRRRRLAVRGVPRVVRHAVLAGSTSPLLLILLALIARGVSFEYRHQRPESRWKAWFDGMIVVGSAVPALLWGVAFANIVQGVPLDADHNYTGTLFDLLNPYALLGGLTTLLLFFTHGVVFVSLKTEGELRERARRLAARSGLVTIVVAAAFLVWTGLAFGTLLVLDPRRGRRASRSSAAGSRTGAARRAPRSRSWPSPSRPPCSPCSRRCSPT